MSPPGRSLYMRNSENMRYAWAKLKGPESRLRVHVAERDTNSSAIDSFYALYTEEMGLLLLKLLRGSGASIDGTRLQTGTVGQWVIPKHGKYSTSTLRGTTNITVTHRLSSPALCLRQRNQ